MKAFIFALAMFSLTLVACGGSETETETQTTDSTAVETPAVVDSAATVTNPVQ